MKKQITRNLSKEERQRIFLKVIELNNKWLNEKIKSVDDLIYEIKQTIQGDKNSYSA